MGLQGRELASGVLVKVRDFSTKAMAVESSERLKANQPMEIELHHDNATFTIHGVPVRSDRVMAASGAVFLTAVEVRWTTPQERSQFENFLWSVPRAQRQG